MSDGDGGSDQASILTINCANNMNFSKPLTIALGIGVGLTQAFSPTSACANAFTDYPAGDDITQSLGQFQIILDPAWVKAFDAIMANSPLSNTSATRHLKLYRHGGIFTSPTLYDPVTRIGRSDSFLTTDTKDSFGVLAGAAPGQTFIKESQLTDIPSWMSEPNGPREIHTFLKSMNLTDSFSTRFGFAVRAGMDAPTRPVSAGQVVAGSATDDFPAKSFFNAYVVVDIPSGGVLPAIQLVNIDPLLVQHTNVMSFPPRVIYQHGNSSAVSMYLNNEITLPNPKGGTDLHLTRGTLFGQLTLAGHGVGFGESETESVQVELENETETGKGSMPINPNPTVQVHIDDFSPDYNQSLPSITGGHFLNDGRFTFEVEHLFPKATHLVQMRTDLLNGDWLTIATVPGTTDRAEIIDPDAGRTGQRFYRVKVQAP